MDAIALFEQKLTQVLTHTELPPQLCAPVAAALIGSSPQCTFYVPATDNQPEDWWVVLAPLNMRERRVEAFPQLMSVQSATEVLDRTVVTQEVLLDRAPGSFGTTICAQPELTDAIIALGGNHVLTHKEDGLPRPTCDLTLFQPNEAFWTLYPNGDGDVYEHDGGLWLNIRRTTGDWLTIGTTPAWPIVTDGGNSHNLGDAIYGMMAMLP